MAESQQSEEHVREVSSALYKYHLDNFLCDVMITTPDGVEVPAHSIVMSTMSERLRSAFEQSSELTGRDFLYRLHVNETDIGIVEMVLQFVYTGAIVLPHDTALDITRVLSCGQKLGLDAGKLAACLGALLSLTDTSLIEDMPPVVLTDEDINLEIVEKGYSVGTSSKTECAGGLAASSYNVFNTDNRCFTATTAVDYKQRDGLSLDSQDINSSHCVALLDINSSRCVALPDINSSRCVGLLDINSSQCVGLPDINGCRCIGLPDINSSRCVGLPDINGCRCIGLPDINSSRCVGLPDINGCRCIGLPDINSSRCVGLPDSLYLRRVTRSVSSLVESSSQNNAKFLAVSIVTIPECDTAVEITGGVCSSSPAWNSYGDTAVGLLGYHGDEQQQRRQQYQPEVLTEAEIDSLLAPLKVLNCETHISTVISQHPETSSCYTSYSASITSSSSIRDPSRLLTDADSECSLDELPLVASRCNVVLNTGLTSVPNVAIDNRSEPQHVGGYITEETVSLYAISRSMSKPSFDYQQSRCVERFKCTFCGACYNCRRDLIQHTAAWHSAEHPYNCAICSHGFHTKSKLAEHMCRHLRIKQHQCHVCGLLFSTGQELTRHCRRKHTTQTNMLRCETCGKRFTSCEKMFSHVCHVTRQCPVCGKTFTRERCMKEHLLAKHTNDDATKRRFTCSWCDKQFTYARTLRQHKHRCNLSVKNTYNTQ